MTKRNRFKGYATFDVTTEEDAVKAIAELDGNPIFGKAIKVHFTVRSRGQEGKEAVGRGYGGGIAQPTPLR